MPRLTEATKQARKDNIANAAIECFARQGFAATSMQDIIDASGVSAGAFYSHYTSKSELVRTVASTVIQGKYSALIESRTSTGNPVSPAQMAEMVLRDNFFTENASLLLQVWTESLHNPELQEMVAFFFTQVRGTVGTLLDEWLAKTHNIPESRMQEVSNQLFDTFVALIHGAMLRAAVDRNVDLDLLISNISRSLDKLSFE